MVFSTLISGFAVVTLLVVLPTNGVGQENTEAPIKPVLISGRIIDGTGAPIARVAVTLEAVEPSEATATTHTDQDGRFTCKATLRKTYELHLEMPGFKGLRVTVETAAGRDIDLGTVVFKAAETDHPTVVPYDLPYHRASGQDPLNQQKEPIPATLCELVKEPLRFTGRVVRLRTRIHPTVIDTPVLLFDRACSDGVVLFIPNESSLKNGGDYAAILLDARTRGRSHGFGEVRVFLRAVRERRFPLQLAVRV
jgi:hypothetical protein